MHKYIGLLEWNAMNGVQTGVVLRMNQNYLSCDGDAYEREGKQEGPRSL